MIGIGGMVIVASMCSELDYYAQDVSGNIWYFGENTWAWDDETGQCTNAGSWEVSKPVGDQEIDPAQPGIVMLATPK